MRTLHNRYWFNFALLVSGLVLTLFCIYLLRGENALRFFDSLGFGRSGVMLNWCSNRVKSLGIGNNFLVEENGKWIWDYEGKVELNYMDVEKWFARNCQLRIETIKFTDFNSEILPLLEVEFIDGELVTIYDLGQGRFQIQNQIFQSPHLDKAYKELLAFKPK